MMTKRRMHTSIVKAPPTQYGVTRRLTSTLMAPVVMALTMLIAACGGGADAVTAPTSPPGAYQLSTVQGKGLPYRVYSDVNYSVDVAAGSVALNTDGSFIATMRSEERVENHLSVYADTASGKWMLTGSKIDFVSTDGSHSVGTWAGRTLTIADSSGVVPLVFVYTMK